MESDTETLSGAEASSTAAGTAEPRETAGATTESPTVTPDAKPGEKSSDSPADANKGRKLTDVLGRATETLGKGITEEGDEPKESSTNGTEAGDGAGAGAPKDERAQATGAEAELDAKYHTRAEWKQAVEIGGEKIKPLLRQIFGREAQMTERLKRAEPEVQALAKIRSLSGNNEAGFKNLNTLLETFQNDPAGALPMLERLVSDAKQRAGLVLQSEDLRREGEKIRQQLKDNLIDQETAQAQWNRLVEIEKARAGQRTAESRLKQTAESQEQQRQQGAQQQVINALNTWEEGVRARFPDIGFCTDVDAPNHGESVMDQVFDLITAKAAVKPPQNAAEHTELAQRCLDSVLKRIGKYVPAGRSMKPLTSQGSSATAKAQPKNFQEAEQFARRKLFGQG